MVVHNFSRRELASIDVVVARPGFPTLPPEPAGAPLCESSPAYGQRGSPLPAAPAGNWIHLAKLAGRRFVCPASRQCGVRGLGRRAQECSQHAVFSVGAPCLRSVCPPRPSPVLCRCRAPFLFGADGQAAGCYLAVCSAPLGLLATGTNGGDYRDEPCRHPPDSAVVLVSSLGEVAALRLSSRRLARHHRGSAVRKYGAHSCPGFPVGTPGECFRILRPLCGQGSLAIESDSDVSPSRRLPSSLAGACRNRRAPYCLVTRCSPARSPLSRLGLVLVPRNARAHDRNRHRGRSGDGGSLRLSAFHRAFHRRGLERRRLGVGAEIFRSVAGRLRPPHHRHARVPHLPPSRSLAR